MSRSLPKRVHGVAWRIDSGDPNETDLAMGGKSNPMSCSPSLHDRGNEHAEDDDGEEEDAEEGEDDAGDSMEEDEGGIPPLHELLPKGSTVTEAVRRNL